MPDSKQQTSRRPDGRFKKGQSGNPAGRPKGSRNGSTVLREAFELNGKAIAQVVIDQAMMGDMTAARLVVERLQPPIRARAETVEFELPENASLAEKADSLLTACAAGQIAPDVAAALIGALGNQARLIELADLEQRLEQLEKELQG
jgi:hypothetical protein